jgi:hypothetical protein
MNFQLYNYKEIQIYLKILNEHNIFLFARSKRNNNYIKNLDFFLISKKGISENFHSIQKVLNEVDHMRRH